MGSPDEPEAGSLSLNSPEFNDDGAIPGQYTCDGDDVSPPLEWSGAPPESAALALIMDDPDARGFVHWVAFDVPASASGSLPAGWSSTAESPQGTNSFGRVGYGGPCPPSGTHRYVFRLLALDAPLELSGSPTADDVRDAASGHVLAEASLTGTYRRAG
jgi:hypothetical protein